MVSIRLFLQPDRIISCRKRKLQSVSMLSKRLESSEGPGSLNELFIELLSGLTERIGEQVIDLDGQLEILEDHSLNNLNRGAIREELNNLRYSFSRLKRYLGPQRDALNALQSDRIELLSHTEKLEIREINDSLTRHIEDLEMMRERAISEQDDLLSQLSEQLNNRLYLLAIISGIFLPLGFLTGLMGVNLAGIPGAEAPYAFGFFTFGLIGISLLLLWVLKRYRWF